MWLSISDMGMGVSYFLGNPSSGDPRCYAQAMVMNFFELASVLWTVVIAYTLYRLIINQKTSVHLMGRFHVFAFGIPLVGTLLPLFTSSYGNTGAWCWITTPEDAAADQVKGVDWLDKGTMWLVLVFYLPLWLAIIYNSFVYVVVTNSLQVSGSEGKRGEERRGAERRGEERREVKRRGGGGKERGAEEKMRRGEKEKRRRGEEEEMRGEEEKRGAR